MEEKRTVAGDILLELKEADELTYDMEEASPMSITRDFGGFFTLLCC